jgi:protein-disulfide isomerase
MPRHPCLALSALLILAAPQIATPQASDPCCQVTPPATAKPTQPVSTVRGSDKAPITILIFSDFESFPCARSANVIDGLLQQTRDVRVIFKHAPAASNPNAMLAHEAALAAGAQGKFWEMHDTLFENQTKLTRADLLGYAKSLGLDLAEFQHALDNHTFRPIVERDLAEAAGLGVTTTPTFFVNGRPASLTAGPARQIDLACAPTNADFPGLEPMPER